ncbi:MAG: prolyl-tRNA synthetase, partial [Methanobacteriota archaeon]
DEGENAEIMETCEKIVDELNDAGIRAELDDSEDNPGAKYYKWELKGTPLRAEVGPRDLESGSAKLVNRLGDEAEAGFDTVVKDVREELDALSEEIRETAADDLDASVVECETYDEARDVVDEGFALVGWNGDEDAGKRIEDEVGVDMLGEPRGYGVGDTAIETCIETGDDAKKIVLLANTY